MEAIIVPRGQGDGYYAFLEISARVNGVEVIVDRRRLGETRWQQHPISVERRLAERRRPQPRTWQEFGFIRVTRP